MTKYVNFDYAAHLAHVGKRMGTPTRPADYAERPKNGPDAFWFRYFEREHNVASLSKDPDCVMASAAHAIRYGGFNALTNRADSVGNDVGKYIAIRAGLVDAIYGSCRDQRAVLHYRTNALGWGLIDHLRWSKVTILPALDSWHRHPFSYCAIEKTFNDKPYLDLNAKAYGDLGMEPLLSLSDARALRDYLTDYLSRMEAE